jgi:hypothetical protein
MTLYKRLRKLRHTVFPHNYIGLLISLLLVIVVAPLLSNSLLANAALDFLVIIMLFTASIFVSRKKSDVWISSVLGSLTAVTWFASVFVSHLPIPFLLFGHSCTILFMLVVASIIARHIFTGEVNSNRICGAICVYILVALCCAFVYLMIMMVDPSGFRINGVVTDATNFVRTERFSISIYYSFCTIATLGNGDILPVNKFARSISWLEAIFGQFYLTILVARLVGLHIANAVERKSQRKSSP